ncbi:hypothetical protein RFI_12334, partial [Reticulomyxa filosa]
MSKILNKAVPLIQTWVEIEHETSLMNQHQLVWLAQLHRRPIKSNSMSNLRKVTYDHTNKKTLHQEHRPSSNETSSHLFNMKLQRMKMEALRRSKDPKFEKVEKDAQQLLHKFEACHASPNEKSTKQHKESNSIDNSTNSSDVVSVTSEIEKHQTDEVVQVQKKEALRQHIEKKITQMQYLHDKWSLTQTCKQWKYLSIRTKHKLTQIESYFCMRLVKHAYSHWKVEYNDKKRKQNLKTKQAEENSRLIRLLHIADRHQALKQYCYFFKKWKQYTCDASTQKFLTQKMKQRQLKMQKILSAIKDKKVQHKKKLETSAQTL